MDVPVLMGVDVVTPHVEYLHTLLRMEQLRQPPFMADTYVIPSFRG